MPLEKAGSLGKKKKSFYFPDFKILYFQFILSICLTKLLSSITKAFSQINGMWIQWPDRQTWTVKKKISSGNASQHVLPHQLMDSKDSASFYCDPRHHQ